MVGFQLSAATIAAIYKERWQIELFFKWIKQNLKIKSFLGETINAVASQIFVALCVYLLTAFQKFVSRTQYDLQAVLCLPFAITFKRRIHTFVTVSASLDVNLFTKFYESPNVIRR